MQGYRLQDMKVYNRKKEVINMMNNDSSLLVGYDNYKGGTNNLVWVSSHGIVTTSLKDKETAIKNHSKKIGQLKLA